MKVMGPIYYVYLVLDIITQILVPFLLILIPAEVIRLLQRKMELNELLLNISLFIGVVLCLNLVRTFVHQEYDKMGIMLTDVQYWRRLEKKVLSCEITQFEDEKERERLWEVLGCLNQGDGMDHYSGVRGLYVYGSALVINVGGFLLYAILAGKLHPLLFLLLFFTAVLNCYAKSRAIRYQFNNMESFWENSSRFWYLKKESINTEKAKDIRMYHLFHWFKRALNQNVKEASSIYDDVQKHHFYANIVMCITSLLRDGLSYGFLIYQLMKGNMDVAEFLVYIGIVAGFGTWISQIVENYTYLRKISNEISMFRAYVEEDGRGSGKVEGNEEVTGDEREEGIKKSKENKNANVDWKVAGYEKAKENGKLKENHKVTRYKKENEEVTIPRACYSIVFEDVSFGYGDKKLFEHFSLKIDAGEKVALVGMNGAGKTTLMKLLCGLYPLSGGRILIDGIDISTMEKEQYYRYISILFQEVKVLPFTIGKNVSCAWTKEEQRQMEERKYDNRFSRAFAKVESSDIHGNVYDEDKVIQCLKQAKLWDKVQTLPKGIHTTLTQILDRSGIQLSGGETQRLMLARALYKDTPILILDEPTAALDPIAESELYEEYSSLCENKISVFISHRLSSTRFCDRILFLEHGKILEEGNHDSLMKMNGKYADMYRIQSHYYQKEVKKHEAGI